MAYIPQAGCKVKSPCRCQWPHDLGPIRQQVLQWNPDENLCARLTPEGALQGATSRLLCPKKAFW